MQRMEGTKVVVEARAETPITITIPRALNNIEVRTLRKKVWDAVTVPPMRTCPCGAQIPWREGQKDYGLHSTVCKKDRDREDFENGPHARFPWEK